MVLSLTKGTLNCLVAAGSLQNLIENQLQGRIQEALAMCLHWV